MKKTVLITGANKSLGFETARQMLQTGNYHVFIGCRDKIRGEQAVEKLKAEGYHDVEVLVIDVTSQQSVDEAKAELETKLTSLDVVINNAGISGGIPQTALSVTVDIARQVFETNLFGVIRTTLAFMDMLKKSDAPRIVNVTSDLGSLTLQSNPAYQHYEVKTGAYGPSKSALNAYTVALAYELRDLPFKINAVNPGYTATDFNHHTGPKSVQDGAAPIAKYAMIGADGPSGQFLSDFGVTPW